MRIDGHTFTVKHPDKLTYPADGITKADVITYYRNIAPHMLPCTRNRPLVMVRYPEGIDQEGFYQKQRPGYFPKWIPSTYVSLVQGGLDEMVVADSAAALAYLASQTVLVFHIWAATVSQPYYPDKVIFDLDPSDNDFHKVMAVAKLLRPLIRKTYGHDAQLVLTGSRGLHMIAAIPPTRDFDIVRDEAHAIATEIASQHYGLATVEARKDKRGDRVYIDVARNAYGQTHVAPYSLRALPGAPVATPIAWSELTDQLSSQQYTMANIFDRLSTLRGGRGLPKPKLVPQHQVRPGSQGQR